MGSYEIIVKIEEMRKRMEEGDASSAQKILDTMEIKKIKNMSDLSLIAEVYVENERYEEALPLYLKIYEKTKSRKSLFQLINLYIKLRNPEEAEGYLKDYEKIAAKDFYKYIFRYKIDKLKGASYEKLIGTLETLKKTEYMEKWAYELAKVYYKAGMEKECIQECSDIILWFGEGIYVEKAKLLRSYYSGEVDKARIMEELKRRAMEDTGRNLDTEKVKEAEELLKGEELEEPSVVAEDEKDDVPVSLTTEEELFLKELKKNIESKLISEDGNIMPVKRGLPTEEESAEEGPVGEESKEDEFIEDSIGEEEADEDSLAEQLSKEVEAYITTTLSDENTGSEGDTAEQEVESIIYELLEEEDMDEENQRLKQLAEELEIDLDEIFGNFLHVKAVKKQLVKSLEGIQGERNKTVLVLITGSNGSGKTTLAKDITMFLYKTGMLKSSRIAKIKADKLNSINIMAKKETLKDCCLVVENAGELKKEAIDGLLELCQLLRGNLAVIFEENQNNMNMLFREYPKLMDPFANRIHLPIYTMQELMGFALACLRQKDYQMNSKAELILKHRINQIAKESEPHVHLEQINSLMQAAMDAADIRTGKQLSNLVSQGRLKDEEILTILPEDLVIKP